MSIISPENFLFFPEIFKIFPENLEILNKE